MTRLTPVAIATAFSLLTAPLAAEIEDGLYAAAVPADAVFLRTLGAPDGPLTLFGRTFGPDDLPRGTYVAISAGLLDGVTPGAHYAILPGAAGPQIIEEPARDDPAKVHLFLINADEDPAALSVADGGPSVIDATAPGAIAARAVNPIAVTLAVEIGSASTQFDLVLRRGVNLTFFVDDGAVYVIEHRFGPVITAD